MDLLVATRNPKKLAELRPLLEPLGYRLHTLAAFPQAPEVEETGATFAENALLKAHSGAAATGLLTLAEDSGLVVDALDGRPGVHSARYAEGQSGKVARLLAELAGVEPARRTCRYVATMALVHPDGRSRVWSGELAGRVAQAPRGNNGFDYDVIFELPDGRTVAELTPEEKNAISHRGRAARELPAQLALFA
jgi:XTP/dITP diphosphohydrolase